MTLQMAQSPRALPASQAKAVISLEEAAVLEWMIQGRAQGGAWLEEEPPPPHPANPSTAGQVVEKQGWCLPPEGGLEASDHLLVPRC